VATLAKLLVEVGIKVDGALKSEQSIRKLQTSAKRFGDQSARSTADAQRGFRRLGTAIRNMATRARANLSSLVERMGGVKTMALAAGAAIAGAALGVFRFVDSQTKAIDETNKLSKSLGIGVEELQRLQFAASQSGVSSEALSLSMRTLNKNLLAAKHGGGDAFNKALERIGLSFKDLDGLSRTQQIGLIGDALKIVGDDAERSALAAEIFGSRAGPELATMLAEGTAGLEALTASAQGVLTQEDADRATEFQDRLGEVKNQISAASNAIMAELLPSVNDATVGFQQWIAENDKLIRQDVPAALRSIGNALAAVGKAVALVVEAVSWMIDKWNALVDALGPVGSVLSAIADAFWSMINPIGKLIELVGSLGDAMYDLGLKSRTAMATMTSAVSANLSSVNDMAAQQGVATVAPWASTEFMGPSPGAGGPAAAQAKARGGGGGGGGRPPPPPPPPKEEKKPPPGVTVDEAIQALLGGNPMIIQERLKGMAADSPAARDIKPTVAMTVNITNNNNDVDVAQTITAPDPVAAGRESVSQIKKVFAKAGLSLPNQVVR
jgi:hypothetical protein